MVDNLAEKATTSVSLLNRGNYASRLRKLSVIRSSGVSTIQGLLKY